MKTEYEATFTDIDADGVREKLRSVSATLRKPEFLQRRSVFHMPAGNEIVGGWARVRDEGDRITMSVKVVSGDRIEDQKEACVDVGDFIEAEQILQALGCHQKAYQETKRELWTIGEVEITIDTWPFLEPFVEIEGVSESAVKNVAEQLGFDWSLARFCAVDALYSERYGLDVAVINDGTPRIVFDMDNPFTRPAN